MNNTYNEFAIKMNQIFRIAAIDCGTFDSICQKEGITEFPTFKVYPLLPQPAYEYKVSIIYIYIYIYSMKESLILRRRSLIWRVFFPQIK